MKCINPDKESYHHALINDFSESSRFLASGAAKGFVAERYVWFADFLHKFNNNTSFNPHVGYVSFFSNHDIFISEYANVTQLTDVYGIILLIADEKLGYEHELSTKQYSKVGQRHAAFDIIEFINQSELVTDADGTISRYHSFYFAPVIYETGYKIDQEYLSLPYTSKPGYDLYIWAHRSFSPLTLKDYSFSVVMGTYNADCTSAAQALVANADIAHTTRLLDYKVVPTDINWGFCDGGIVEFIHYPYDFKSEEPWTCHPYIGLPLFYNQVYDGDDKVDGQFQEATIALLTTRLLPQLSQKNVIEKQKLAHSGPVTPEGKSFFHAPGLSYEEDDQSQIAFHISRNNVYDEGGGNYVIGQEMYDSSNFIRGIDVQTERNRRYSSIVTTEPYMKVRPLANGQAIDYKIVGADGGDISFSWPKAWTACVKIRAPRAYIRELDRELDREEYNTDILHVLHLNGPEMKMEGEDTEAYDTFKGASLNDYFKREEYALDDLLGGLVGDTGVKRFSFYTNSAASPEVADIESYYTDQKIRICGAGHYSKKNGMGSASVYAKLYCTNYVPGGPDTVSDSLITMPQWIHQIDNYELFRPMLRIPGIHGYVKIIRRDPYIEPVLLSDGREEIMYEVEFPFCAGSYQVRVAGQSEFKKTQIFKKSSYINAGSWALDSNNHYDSYNARYAPEGDDAFCRIDYFKGMDSPTEDTIESDPESAGGHLTQMVSRPANRLIYPAHLCYYRVDETSIFISMTKPRQTYPTFGTFDIDIDDSLFSHNPADMKMVWNVDNRVWKYGDNKFSSYINREYPSYVLELDTAELSSTTGRKQDEYAGIPDIKRWIYSKVSAFCHTAYWPPATSNEDYTDGTRYKPTEESLSDVIIEVWDTAYPVNGSTRAMWRPFSMTLYDNKKYTAKTLVSGLHAAVSKVLVHNNLYFVILEKYDSSAIDYGLTDEEAAEVDEKSNLVMYDSETGRMYHVAYVEQDTVYPNNTRLKVYFTTPSASYNITDGSGIPANIYDWEGPVSLHKPYSKLNKKTDFEFKSCETQFSSSAVDTLFKTRHMDFGSRGDDSDFDRYVDENSKIYIRIRPLKARTYPVSYGNFGTGSDTMQYIDSRVTGVVNDYTNMPWWNPITPPSGDWDDGLDWSKIDIVEYIRRFGLSYFSLLSR